MDRRVLWISRSRPACAWSDNTHIVENKPELLAAFGNFRKDCFLADKGVAGAELDAWQLFTHAPVNYATRTKLVGEEEDVDNFASFRGFEKVSFFFALT